MSKSYSPPQVWNQEKKREELVRRMIRAYNKNKNKRKTDLSSQNQLSLNFGNGSWKTSIQDWTHGGG